MPETTTRYHGRDLRRGRYSNPGQIYAITLVTRDRKPIFHDFSTARIPVKVMMGHQQRNLAHTLCYVVMPDHLHWLMQLGDGQNMSQIVRTLKSLVSHHLGGPVWQRGFFDHALRREEDMLAIARYIVANPLRAGLVDHINDYPHWDAVWLE